MSLQSYEFDAATGVHMDGTAATEGGVDHEVTEEEEKATREIKNMRTTAFKALQISKLDELS